MADLLTGYTFNRDTGRYRSSKTGRFVARSKVVELLESQVTESENRLQALVEAYHERKIAPAVFVAQARTEIKTAHLTNRAIGAGGWDNLDNADYGAIGGTVRQSYQKLIGTVEEIERGELSVAQAKQRMRMQSGDARRQFFNAEQRRRKPSEGMVILERRIAAADAATCEECMGFYKQGWQPQGVLPAPTEQCRCRGNCRCTRMEKEVQAEDVGEMIGTKK